MEVFQVDSFTTRPFSGNPAGVCLLDREPPDDWMQSFAAEMNLSETAFVVPDDPASEKGSGVNSPRPTVFRLRWFTPVREVDLCGHATLASAHVLWETGRLRKVDEARFRTLSGLLVARRKASRIEMDFPSEPAEATRAPEALLKGLGVSALFVGQNRMDYLVEVESEELVRSLKPDFSRLRELDMRGIIVTSRSSDEQFDFVSRFFAPAFGVDEDPVTGSAHCCLAPYWGESLKKKEMLGRQLSRRGGEVGVRWEGDRVILIGSAVTVMSCELAAVARPPEESAEGLNSYQKRMEEQVQKLALQIDQLLGRLEGNAKLGYDRLSEQVRGKQKVMEKKLVEFQAAGSGAWQEMRPGLERAWRELKEAFEKLSSRL